MQCTLQSNETEPQWFERIQCKNKAVRVDTTVNCRQILKAKGVRKESYQGVCNNEEEEGGRGAGGCR